MNLRPPISKSGGRAFTLVELMVVMAVMAVLMTILAPAFNNLGKGSTLKAAGNTISNLALIARQNSLAKNAMTAMVVVGASGTPSDYRAVGLFEIVPKSDGSSPVPTDWTQLGKWETLPEGVTIDSCTFDAQTFSPTPALPLIQYENQPIGQYQFVVFVSNGSLLTSTVSQLRIASGYRNGTSENVVYTEKTIGGVPTNYYLITVLNANGRVKVEVPEAP